MAECSGAEGYDPSKDPKRKAKSKDPRWKYGFWPELSDKNIVQCILCGKKVYGGIKRFKQHLTGGYGDVSKCPQTTTEIAKEMHKAIMSKKRNKPIQFDDSDEVEEIQSSNISSTASNPSHASSTTVPSSGTASKRMKNAFQFTKSQSQSQTKTIETHLRKSPEEVVDERHRKGPSQTTLENHLRSPEEKEKVDMYIANWFYESGIPFNAANRRSYEVMVEAIGQYGSGFKPPSYHELRVPLLAKAKTKTKELKEKHKTSWKQYGCTLMSDGWTDRRGRHLINFLANSPAGTYFLGSVDASAQSQDASMLTELLDGKIKEIGAEYVVQVVTDNAANYKAAGRMLMERIPTLFWTPCAAHCLDLMLEDIGNLKQFKSTIVRGRKITTFIYRHGRLLEAMRSKTNGRDLVRSGVTRFATSFLTLQSLCKHKDSLRHLFISDDWTHSRLSTTEAGKQVYDTIFSSSFWHVVEDCIRASQPLLVVLRIVDSDERPAMPEIFAAMEFAKKKIKDAFNNKQRLYKKVIDIIERRWACQMEQKLYGAALYLNPGKYFDIKEKKESDLAYKLRSDFNVVLSKMVPDQVLADKISDLADVYESSRDDFSKDMTIRQRKTKNPIDWWNAFGGCAIELTKFAKRIVGLCCSSSGCERNWSTFEFIHTKKRNRLEHQRLNDLVYVQYNRRIVDRFQKRRELGRNFDPLVLDDFDWGNEWIVREQDVVHDGDDLIWEDVDRAVGASDAAEGRNLPRRTGLVYSRRGYVSTSTKPTQPRIRVVNESDSDVGEEEEGLPNDDENVDDDYGRRVTTVSSDDTVAGRDDDDLILDDLA